MKEALERAILHGNICLKKWDLNQKRGWGGYYDQTRSLIISSVSRELVNYYMAKSNWRGRKELRRRLNDGLFFTTTGLNEDVHITSIQIPPIINIEICDIDYDALNKEALRHLPQNYIPSPSLADFNLDSIKAIKF